MEFITPRVAATLLNTTVNTLQHLRNNYKGARLPYYKRGHYILYDKQEVLEFSKTFKPNKKPNPQVTKHTNLIRYEGKLS